MTKIIEATPDIVGKGAKHRACWRCRPSDTIKPEELAQGYGHQAGMTGEPVTSRKSQGIRLTGFWVQCPNGHGKPELDACLSICKGRKAKADIVKCRMTAFWSNYGK